MNTLTNLRTEIETMTQGLLNCLDKDDTHKEYREYGDEMAAYLNYDLQGLDDFL
jgi:hypothetical protein